MKHVIRFPLSAAALAVLLAACGGGSGGTAEKAVSSSPTAPGSTSSANAGAAAGASASSTTNVTIDSASTPAAPGGTGNDAGSVNPNPPTSPAPDSTSPTPPAADNSGNPAPATPAPATDAGSQQASPTQPSTPPAATPSPAQPVPLVSASGVRGDVLLGMLSQKPCKGAWPEPVKADDGSFLSEGFQQIVSDSHMGNYVVRPNYPVVGYINTLGCNGQDYRPVAPGSHEYYHGQTVFAKFYRTPRDFVFLHANVATQVTTESVTLSQLVKVSGHAFQKPSFEVQLQAPTDYTFRFDALIPFGDVQQWTAPNPQDAGKPQFDKLMLLKGAGARDVRLCWNTDLVEVKRLQCMDWRIQEDWKAGTELVNLGQTLIEDRSVYPDETGFAHWRGTDQ